MNRGRILETTLRPLHNTRGQILPYFFVMMIILIISWAMIINMAKLLRDRMMMQNAADNAALSVSVYKARVLNTLGLLNYAIAATLFGPESGPVSGYLSYYKYGVICSVAGMPLSFPLSICPMGGIPPSCRQPGLGAVDSQKKVAAYLDIIEGDGSVHIKDIRMLVSKLAGCQDLIKAPFEANAPVQVLATEIGKRQEKNNAGEYTGADVVVVTQGIPLGLLRNKNGVIYHRSKKLDGIEFTVAKYAANALINVLLEVPVTINELFAATELNEDGKSWLYADKTVFDRNQKIVVAATKLPNSASNRGYPLFGKWIGISWPPIETVAAAAVYNASGPMFPLEESGKPSDNISPVMREYRKARYQGWDAHLVPLGGMYKH